jgi:hypothetical protein
MRPSSKERFSQRRKKTTLLNIKQVGAKYVQIIMQWQTEAIFSDDVAFMSPMIQEDIARIKALRTMIKELDIRVAENY